MPDELDKSLADVMNNNQSKSIKGIIKIAIGEKRSDEKQLEQRKKNIILFKKILPVSLRCANKFVSVAYLLRV